MRSLRVAGLLLVLLPIVLLGVSAQAGAAKPQANKVRQTSAPVRTLAMDWPRVAYASGGRVYVWNVATGATSVVKGSYGNAQHSVDAAEIAISGKRVAWTKREQFGNKEASERLYTALVGGSAHLLRSAYIGNGHDGWIGAVVGSAKLLAVSTWNWDETTLDHQRLNVITSKGGLRWIHSGTGTIVAAAAEGKHIAVAPLAWPVGPRDGFEMPPTSPPTVGIYSDGGRLLGQVALATAHEIALSGNQLVALTTPSPRTVQVFDWTTGALVHSWPVATARSLPWNLAAYGRFAVYSVYPRFAAPRALHLLDLRTGKDVVIATAIGGYQHDAAIGPRGLVYVVNSGPHRKLVFVPTAKLVAAVR